jgi:hypothetical protein
MLVFICMYVCIYIYIYNINCLKLEYAKQKAVVTTETAMSDGKVSGEWPFNAIARYHSVTE